MFGIIDHYQKQFFFILNYDELKSFVFTNIKVVISENTN